MSKTIHCPYWIDGKTNLIIRCEGSCARFSTKGRKDTYIHKRCTKNPEWRKCKTAVRLNKKYEEGEG